MTKLEESVQLLYETFARYPCPAKIGCCPCGCTKPNATDHLIAAPLREISFQGMACYSFKAMTTQGSVDDFRYLLPRLFQGIAEEEYAYNPEILFGKLSYAKWSQWPEDEVLAIKNYLLALWQAGLTSFPICERLPAFIEIESLIASIAQTGKPLEPYLENWTNIASRAADEHLVQFVTMFGEDFSNGQTLHEAFWEKSKQQADALRTWLLLPDTLNRVSDAAHLLRNDGYEHLFEPALQTLRSEAQL